MLSSIFRRSVCLWKQALRLFLQYFMRKIIFIILFILLLNGGCINSEKKLEISIDLWDLRTGMPEKVTERDIMTPNVTDLKLPE